VKITTGMTTATIINLNHYPFNQGMPGDNRAGHPRLNPSCFPPFSPTYNLSCARAKMLIATSPLSECGRKAMYRQVRESSLPERGAPLAGAYCIRYDVSAGFALTD
jgi:hypothetical protein